MISLSIPLFNIFEKIEVLNNYLLIIENKRVLYNFLKDIGNGCIYDELIQIYDENNRKLKNIDYIDFVPSILSLDINNKKNVNALIRLVKKSHQEDIKNSINILNRFLKDLFNLFNFNIAALFIKAYAIRINFLYQRLFNKLFCILHSLYLLKCLYSILV